MNNTGVEIFCCKTNYVVRVRFESKKQLFSWEEIQECVSAVESFESTGAVEWAFCCMMCKCGMFFCLHN